MLTAPARLMAGIVVLRGRTRGTRWRAATDADLPNLTGRPHTRKSWPCAVHKQLLHEAIPIPKPWCPLTAAKS